MYGLDEKLNQQNVQLSKSSLLFFFHFSNFIDTLKIILIGFSLVFSGGS